MIKTEFKKENVIENFESNKPITLIPFLSNREYLLSEIVDIDHLGDKLELKNILTGEIEEIKVNDRYINTWCPVVGDFYCHELHNGYQGCIKKNKIKNYMMSPHYVFDTIVKYEDNRTYC